MNVTDAVLIVFDDQEDTVALTRNLSITDQAPVFDVNDETRNGLTLTREEALPIAKRILSKFGEPLDSDDA